MGARTAALLAERGFSVALLDVDAAALESSAAACGPLGMAIECNVADSSSVERAVAQSVARFGGIDVVVANAGIGTFSTLRYTDPEVFAAAVAVNLTGSFRTIHAALPHLIERRGYVMAVSSLAAILAPLGMGAYAASKAGVEQMANGLRMEVAHLGVDVGVAYLSCVATAMVEGTEREHPGFARMRSGLRGPPAKTVSVDVAARAPVNGIERRARRVSVPRFVAALFHLRGLVGRAAERDFRVMAEDVDALCAQRVAERGAFASAVRAGAAREFAARSAQVDQPRA